jgi:hypothetical protein
MFHKIRHFGKAILPLINFKHPHLSEMMKIRTSSNPHKQENNDFTENYLKEKIPLINRNLFIPDEEVNCINGYMEVPEFRNIKLKKK